MAATVRIALSLQRFEGPRGKSVKNRWFFNGSEGGLRGPWEEPKSERSIYVFNLEGLLEIAKLDRIHSQRFGGGSRCI